MEDSFSVCNVYCFIYAPFAKEKFLILVKSDFLSHMICGCCVLFKNFLSPLR